MPAELLLLATRLLFLGALYAFLYVILREIRRDWLTSALPPGVARLVAVRSEAMGVCPGQAFDLEGTSEIGRHADAQIRLEDPHVSARHAQIYRAGATWNIRDLNSTNGTLVNGQSIQTDTRLTPRAMVEIGTSLFRFELDA